MNKIKPIMSIVIIVSALLLIIYGSVNSGFTITESKGSGICWECIGLGRD